MRAYLPRKKVLENTKKEPFSMLFIMFKMFNIELERMLIILGKGTPLFVRTYVRYREQVKRVQHSRYCLTWYNSHIS